MNKGRTTKALFAAKSRSRMTSFWLALAWPQLGRLPMRNLVKRRSPWAWQWTAGGPCLSPTLVYKRIRRISPNGIIATVARDGTARSAGDVGPATSAQLTSPRGVVDRVGNLFMADWGNLSRAHRLSKLIDVVRAHEAKVFFSVLKSFEAETRDIEEAA